VLEVQNAAPRLTSSDMRKISELVYAKSGIALRDSKRAMVMARLQKRLWHGGFASFSDYLKHLESDESGAELTAVLDAITTNHTSFFREVAHFHFLASHVVPALLTRPASRPIAGWSAACSTGEEAYSIAVTLLDRVPIAQHDRIRLLASDLSKQAIQTARAGVYPLGRVDHLPQATLRRHFERGIGEQEGLVRLNRSVRRLIDFRKLNLIEVDNLAATFDFIFCRNVMIYFDCEARQRVVNMVERHLTPGGHLFLSHSEGLSEINHGLKWCMPGVYRRAGA
jgi:chemotaxis protein methyltransferase CheR